MRHQVAALGFKTWFSLSRYFSPSDFLLSFHQSFQTAGEYLRREILSIDEETKALDMVAQKLERELRISMKEGNPVENIILFFKTRARNPAPLNSFELSMSSHVNLPVKSHRKELKFYDFLTSWAVNIVMNSSKFYI